MRKKKQADADEPLVPDAPVAEEPTVSEALQKDEPLAAAFVDKFLDDEDALEEALVILKMLAKSTPNLMGTAHGIALIHAAQKWVVAHVPPEEPA